MKLANLWRRHRSVHYFTPWDGTWADAVKASAGPDRLTYGTEASGQIERERRAEHLQRLPHDPTAIDHHTQDLLAALSVILSEQPSRSLRVLDFGGSWGVFYYHVQRALPRVQFDWLIVETEATANALAGEGEEGLHWQSTLPPAAGSGEKPFDLCLANASFQHVEDYTVIVEKLAALGRYVLVGRVPVIGEPEDRTVHHRMRNDRRISLPARLLSEEKLLRVLTGLGRQRLTWTVPEDIASFQKKTLSYRSYLVETDPVTSTTP